MTMPHEERWALENTRKFLRDLLNPKTTPKVPKAIRNEASRCLKHYPMSFHLDDMYRERIANEPGSKIR